MLPYPNQMNLKLLKYYQKKYVMKDRDFRFFIQYRKADLVNISLEDKHRIITQIKNDIYFLESNNMMDYSLLLAIEKISKHEKD